MAEKSNLQPRTETSLSTSSRAENDVTSTTSSYGSVLDETAAHRNDVGGDDEDED